MFFREVRVQHWTHLGGLAMSTTEFTCGFSCWTDRTRCPTWCPTRSLAAFNLSLFVFQSCFLRDVR